jgi:hypothetical protein
MVRSIRRAGIRRAAVALLVLGGSALVGLGSGTAAAAVVTPSGGCWIYKPSGAALTSAPTSDISTAREPWSASGQGGIALETSGPTALDSLRHVAVTVVDGPVLSTAFATSGTASFLLSVDGVRLADPVTATFQLAAGEQVDGLVAQTDVPIAKAGAHQVALEGVYFDDPANALRMACNGQAVGVASPGKNAATTPVATDVRTSFTAVKGPNVTVTGVTNQAVTDAGRPADVVSLKLAGFAPSASAAIQLCATSTGLCSQVASVGLDGDGAAATTFMTPDSVPAAVGTLRIDVGGVQASTAFTVLGTQTMVASEKLGTKSTTITFVGTGWDPKREVRLQGRLGQSGSSSKSSDGDVTVDADAVGGFTATYTVRDADTVSVVADQVRTTTRIGSIYLTSGVVGSATTDTGDSDSDDDGSDDGDTGTSGSGTGTTGGSGTSSGSGSGPISTPTTTVPDAAGTPAAPVGGGAASTVGELTISDVRLDGQPGIGDLFGGAPHRTLVFVVENTGTTAVAAPMVRVAVGRSKSVKPLPVAVPMSDLPVGGRAIVSVPVELPPAALGAYHVAVQVGDSADGTFDVRWTSFPWGLLTLDAAGLVLLVVGAAPFLAERLPRRKPAIGLVGVGDAEAIVDLRAAERWWASRSAKSRSRAS